MTNTVNNQYSTKGIDSQGSYFLLHYIIILYSSFVSLIIYYSVVVSIFLVFMFLRYTASCSCITYS